MKSIKELMRLYRFPGGNDCVADHLQEEGKTAQTELIRLLESNHTSREEAAFIIHLLELHFPSPKSTAAIEQYAATFEDSYDQDFVLRKHRAMTGARRKLSDFWDHLPEDYRKLCEMRHQLPEHIRKRLPQPPDKKD
jgi:hypothetical protein